MKLSLSEIKYRPSSRSLGSRDDGMEKRVKIPVSDEIYELIERCAKADGVTPDQWTEKALSQAYKSLKKKV